MLLKKTVVRLASTFLSTHLDHVVKTLLYATGRSISSYSVDPSSNEPRLSHHQITNKSTSCMILSQNTQLVRQVTYRTFILKVFIHQMYVLKTRQSTFFQLTPCLSIDSGMIILFKMLCMFGSSEFDSTRNGAQQNSTVALQSYGKTKIKHQNNDSIL